MTMLYRSWTAVMIAVAFWVGLGAVAHAQDIQRVAVLELSGSSVSGEVRLQLSDALREGVITEVRGQGVGVMTRENMAVVMRDMGLDPTCVEAECEVETGRNIGARFVVSGAVTQVESAYVMTIKVHDTVSALVLDSRTTQASRQLALVDQARALGRAVSAVILREASSQVEEGSVGQGGDWGVSAGNQGVVRFESTPPGATVFVDGQLQCKTTPCDAEVSQGEHSAEFQLSRHHPARSSFSVVTGQMKTVSEPLKPKFGVIEFTSTPSAAVVLDGRQVCRQTPCELKLDAGQHQVQMQAKDYHAATQSLTVSEGVPAAVNLKLRPTFANLTVKTTRKGAKIQINGRPMTATGQSMQMPPGPVIIELDERCHIAEPVMLELVEGDDRTVTLDVAQHMADLKVEVGERSGGLAPGHFVLDGERWGSNPNHGGVPVCSEMLTLVQYGETVWTKRLSGLLDDTRPTILQPEVAQNTMWKKWRRSSAERHARLKSNSNRWFNPSHSFVSLVSANGYDPRSSYFDSLHGYFRYLESQIGPFAGEPYAPAIRLALGQFMSENGFNCDYYPCTDSWLPIGVGYLLDLRILALSPYTMVRWNGSKGLSGGVDILPNMGLFSSKSYERSTVINFRFIYEVFSEPKELYWSYETGELSMYSYGWGLSISRGKWGPGHKDAPAPWPFSGN